MAAVQLVLRLTYSVDGYGRVWYGTVRYLAQDVVSHVHSHHEVASQREGCLDVDVSV